jgi:hypothetical protein
MLKTKVTNFLSSRGIPASVAKKGEFVAESGGHPLQTALVSSPNHDATELVKGYRLEICIHDPGW